ncbi:precursor of CEP7-like [Abrus precatorius]|uniref:Precursor of CEP7-like n=1 Tax=Abrus precatorius TaxID=3816 RepID=A0A8B8JRF4_ABRPR|nr:precursor of CEP7-like [Abrus precatorius]
MPNLKIVFTVNSILLALMFFNGSFSAMGRPLKTSYENSVKEMATAENNILLWRRSILENAFATKLDSKNPRDYNVVEKWIDDFRPTDPGHSPGAGHSSPNPREANLAQRP